MPSCLCSRLKRPKRWPYRIRLAEESDLDALDTLQRKADVGPALKVPWVCGVLGMLVYLFAFFMRSSCCFLVLPHGFHGKNLFCGRISVLMVGHFQLSPSNFSEHEAITSNGTHQLHVASIIIHPHQHF